MTLYTDRKPREAVARALHAERSSVTSWEAERPVFKDSVRRQAAAALNTLRELGFITSEGLDAIHAEEDANGEPRSSVVPGSGR